MADDRIVNITIKSNYDGKGDVDAKKGLKQVEAQAKQTGAATKAAGETGAQGVNAITVSVGKLLATIAAAKAVIDFFASSIAAANTNARAVNTLAAAYQAVGYTAKGAMQQAQEFASKMQSLTGIADEAFLNAQRLLANYGVVGTKAQEAIQAAYALSIGKQMDFAAAMDIVSKAAVGQTQTLARYGIQIDKNTKDGEKFEAVLAKINELWGATAQAAMGDSATKLNALKESWGDFKEQIGSGLNDGLVPAVEFLTKAVGWLNKGFKSAGAVFAIVFDQIFIELQRAKVAFYGLADAALNSLQPFVKVLSFVPKVGSQIESAFNDAKNSMAQTSKQAYAQVEVMREMRTPISEIWKTEKDITSETKEQLKLNEQQVNSGHKKVAIAKEELEAVKKAREEEEKRVRRVLNDAGVGPKQTTSGWDTSSYVSDKPRSMADIVTGTDLSETDNFLKTIEEQKAGLEDLYNKKLELLEQGHLDEETFAEAKLELDRQYGAQTAALEDQLSARRQKTMATALNNLASLQNSSNKKMAAVGKTAAVAQATIDTYKAANAAYSAMAGIPVIGPALAVAAAAAAIAAGLNNVAQISGVQLADGGLVKAVTGGVPAVVGEGGSDEAVLPLDNAKAMQRIGGAIAEQGGSVGGAVVLTQNITIQAGESLIPDITNALRNATVDALEMANLTVKVGNSQQGYSV